MYLFISLCLIDYFGLRLYLHTQTDLLSLSLSHTHIYTYVCIYIYMKSVHIWCTLLADANSTAKKMWNKSRQDCCRWFITFPLQFVPISKDCWQNVLLNWVQDATFKFPSKGPGIYCSICVCRAVFNRTQCWLLKVSISLKVPETSGAQCYKTFLPVLYWFLE